MSIISSKQRDPYGGQGRWQSWLSHAGYEPWGASSTSTVTKLLGYVADIYAVVLDYERKVHPAASLEILAFVESMCSVYPKVRLIVTSDPTHVCGIEDRCRELGVPVLIEHSTQCSLFDFLD